MPTLQEEFLRIGEISKVQYDNQIEVFEKVERRKQQQLAHLRYVTGIADRLNLNGAFVREFSGTYNNRIRHILKELSKRNPKGTKTKCVNCNVDGTRPVLKTEGAIAPAEGKGCLLYIRFNLCTQCFALDTYGASFDMGKFTKRT